MASKVGIANIALTNLGQPSIISLTESNDRARAMNLRYDDVRDAVLSDHVWPFSRKRASLARESSTPLFEFTFEYALPTDCLRVPTSEKVNRDFVWRIEGRKLLTDESVAEIVYVSRVDDPNEYDSVFIEAFGQRLAYETAEILTRDRKLKADIWEKYQAVLRRAAGIADEQSGTQPEDRFSWVTARE